MWVTFKSTAAAEICMLDDLAKSLLRFMEKEFKPQGVIHHSEMSTALKKLLAAINKDKADRSDIDALHPHGQHNNDNLDFELSLGLAQRAFPLLNMLQLAEKENADVLWEV